MKKTIGLLLTIAALILATGCTVLQSTGETNTTGQAIEVTTVQGATADAEPKIILKEVEKLTWKPVNLTLDELDILKTVKPKKDFVLYVTKQNIQIEDEEFPLNKVIATRVIKKGKEQSQVVERTFTITKFQKGSDIKFIYQYEDKSLKFDQKEFLTVKDLKSEIEKKLVSAI